MKRSKLTFAFPCPLSPLSISGAARLTFSSFNNETVAATAPSYLGPTFDDMSGFNKVKAKIRLLPQHHP